MIFLKNIIKYTNANALEALWVEVVTPEQVIPELIDPDTGDVTPEKIIPAVEIAIRRQAYSDRQMGILRQDIGDEMTSEYEVMIKDVEANQVPLPQPPLEEILAERKAERQAIVDSITVTVSSGKVFDGNEDAQSRMSRAIQAAQIANTPSTTWVLANNVPTAVTLAELQEALVLSMQAMGAVWAAPYEE